MASNSSYHIRMKKERGKNAFPSLLRGLLPLISHWPHQSVKGIIFSAGPIARIWLHRYKQIMDFSGKQLTVCNTADIQHMPQANFWKEIMLRVTVIMQNLLLALTFTIYVLFIILLKQP